MNVALQITGSAASRGPPKALRRPLGDCGPQFGSQWSIESVRSNKTMVSPKSQHFKEIIGE